MISCSEFKILLRTATSSLHSAGASTHIHIFQKVAKLSMIPSAECNIG